MILSQRGEGRGGWIFGTFVLLLAAYLGLKFVPVMVHIYAFEDRVREECKYLRGRSDEALERDLIEVAQLERLPVEAEDIEIRRLRTANYWVLRVKIDYTVPIQTAFKEFNWNRVVDYEAPMFE